MIKRDIPIETDNNNNYEVGLIYLGDGVFEAYCPIMAEECSKHFQVGKAFILYAPEITHEQMRTKLQNRSLWLYLTQLAKTLNDGGFDLRRVVCAFKEEFPLACTKNNLKEIIWNTIQKALFGKLSSTTLSTKELSETYLNVNQFTTERFKVTVPWPEKQSLVEEE